ncbi:Golgi-associated plant pathogenesis-related protein 1-like isoform X1 [Limulus polyphemus]|uniref:Golgi-associated plant pathogenesis-related protein 1-like isoform X1 n=1 Tax=Limulus polyphemus TaxID=6850 RepID=A0ABM1BXR9_LIMPO|nr:Golgi-associated plant pathogenesis-related protein 1-like isoform X1 [Limulus polyphemus]
MRALRSASWLPRYHRAKVLQRSSRQSELLENSSPSRTLSPPEVKKIVLQRPLFIRFNNEENRTYYSQSEFVVDCLQWHNTFRKRHEVPPLEFSYQMCNLAQFWANHLAHANTFYYRNYRDIGENLFCRCSFVPEFDVTGEQVVKYWYRERKLYDFDKQPSLLHAKAGHFTQMVWRSSKEFGVGKARSRFGKIIVVANYKPAGNVTGEFQDNVFSPTKDDHLGNLDNG